MLLLLVPEGCLLASLAFLNSVATWEAAPVASHWLSAVLPLWFPWHSLEVFASLDISAGVEGLVVDNYYSAILSGKPVLPPLTLAVVHNTAGFFLPLDTL